MFTICLLQLLLSSLNVTHFSMYIICLCLLRRSAEATASKKTFIKIKTTVSCYLAVTSSKLKFPFNLRFDELILIKQTVLKCKDLSSKENLPFVRLTRKDPPNGQRGWKRSIVFYWMFPSYIIPVSLCLTSKFVLNRKTDRTSSEQYWVCEF